MGKITIVFLSDFGYASPYVGICKGVILGINPSVNIIDLTHDIPAYNVMAASFILKHSYIHFPASSIFLCVVDPQVGSKRKAVIIRAYGRFFVGPDNGIFSFIGKNDIEKIVSIENNTYFSNIPTDTFHGRYIFAPVCAFISLGTPIENFGPTVKNIMRIKEQVAQYVNKGITGRIIYIDHFGNLVTNIEKEFIEKCFPQTSFKKLKIILDTDYVIKGISRTYSDCKKGEVLALINSFNLLEISVNCGNAAQYLKKEENTKVRVTI